MQIKSAAFAPSHDFSLSRPHVSFLAVSQNGRQSLTVLPAFSVLGDFEIKTGVLFSP